MKALEVIEWIDSSAFTTRWMSPEDMESEYNGNAVCHTVGFLAKEDENAVILAQGYSLKESGEVDEWGHLWVIPKCCIVQRAHAIVGPNEETVDPDLRRPFGGGFFPGSSG